MSAPRAFAKFVGAGNDFLFMDAREGRAFPRAARADFARAACDRHFGAGADGAVFVEGDAARGWRWDFYNRDGSQAEMCGNAARCMAEWSRIKLGLNEIDFATTAGLVRARSLGVGRARVELGFVARAARPFMIESPELSGGRVSGFLFNTGVPHAVLEVAKIEDARAWPETVRRLRWLPEAGPKGANATFFARAKSGAGRIDSVTFERGVEDFTLACGTGVVAAALAYARVAGGAGANVSTPGGELRVEFEATGETGVALEGSAEFVYEGAYFGKDSAR